MIEDKSRRHVLHGLVCPVSSSCFHRYFFFQSLLKLLRRFPSMSVSDHKKKSGATPTHGHTLRRLTLVSWWRKRRKRTSDKDQRKKKKSIRNIGKKRQEHATRKMNSAITWKGTRQKKKKLLLCDIEKPRKEKRVCSSEETKERTRCIR